MSLIRFAFSSISKHKHPFLLDQLWTYGSNWTYELRKPSNRLFVRRADSLRIDVERGRD